VRNREEDSRIVGDGKREEKSVTPHKRAAQHLADCAMIGAHWQETHDHDNSQLTVEWTGDQTPKAGQVSLHYAQWLC
jgi:hypothetical protein